MTSKQVLLIAAAACLAGCSLWPKEAEQLPSPYAQPRLFAVAPLNNESGSYQADGYLLADHLARQFENASNIDVLPVNRTLAAMEALGMPAVASAADVQQLLAALGADAVIVGTITAYDPYDPPKMGLALELYLPWRDESGRPTVDPRTMSRAATSGQTEADVPEDALKPVSTASAFFDAADPPVRRDLKAYAYRRGGEVDDDGWKKYSPFESSADDEGDRLYRINMDLFSEFVGYQMSRRLLAAEMRRMGPPDQVAKTGP